MDNGWVLLICPMTRQSTQAQLSKNQNYTSLIFGYRLWKLPKIIQTLLHISLVAYTLFWITNSPSFREYFLRRGLLYKYATTPCCVRVIWCTFVTQLSPSCRSKCHISRSKWDRLQTLPMRHDAHTAFFLRKRFLVHVAVVTPHETVW